MQIAALAAVTAASILGHAPRRRHRQGACRTVATAWSFCHFFDIVS